MGIYDPYYVQEMEMCPNCVTPWKCNGPHLIKRVFSPMGIDKTLDERGSRYGAFKDQAVLAQAIKATFMKGRNWSILPDDSREALETIATKISRILHGDPEYADNWHDIMGYAKLVDDRINGIIK